VGAGVTRRHVPLLLAAGALVLAVLLALLARDVRAWDESVRVGDERFAVSPGPDDLWEPSSPVFGGAGSALLALGDDLELRRAEQLFRRSRPRAGSLRTTKQLAYATQAQVAFSAIQLGDAPRRVRSQAANEIGALAMADVLANAGDASGRFDTALRKFAEAVRLDPTNESARHNLELALALLQGGDERVVPENFEAGSSGTASGAGSGGAGSGC
jgi:tetratricopeptide (TPR) repeat protein